MFEQYDVVRIKELLKPIEVLPDGFNCREPRVGDIATVVELYETPTVGYELECCRSDGQTEWLMTFSQNEIELELIRRNA